LLLRAIITRHSYTQQYDACTQGHRQNGGTHGEGDPTFDRRAGRGNFDVAQRDRAHGMDYVVNTLQRRLTCGAGQKMGFETRDLVFRKASKGILLPCILGGMREKAYPSVVLA
jgi:hypothetical protein